MPTDIFKADLSGPADIYVVAPGPNGLAHIDRIPNDAFIIVVNKAIEYAVTKPLVASSGADCYYVPEHLKSGVTLIKPLKPTLWMCSEPLAGETDWFKENIDVNKGIACFWQKYLGENHPDIAYYWEHEEPLLTTDSYYPIPGVLRRRATVAGQAVQLAYWLYAKRIILCGFDASGNTYFDDTPAGEGSSYKMREGDWWWVTRYMNPMVKWMGLRGVKVVSLSETAIDVEVI